MDSPSRGRVSASVDVPLTNRERQILRLLGEGNTSKDIATTLNISVTTIGSHRRSLCRKLNVHSTAELVYRGTQLVRVASV